MIYEYECPNDDCGTKLFEKHARMSESSEPRACPDCGFTSERVLSSSADMTKTSWHNWARKV